MGLARSHRTLRDLATSDPVILFVRAMPHDLAEGGSLESLGGVGLILSSRGKIP